MFFDTAYQSAQTLLGNTYSIPIGIHLKRINTFIDRLAGFNYLVQLWAVLQSNPEVQTVIIPLSGLLSPPPNSESAKYVAGLKTNYFEEQHICVFDCHVYLPTLNREGRFSTRVLSRLFFQG